MSYGLGRSSGERSVVMAGTSRIWPGLVLVRLSSRAYTLGWGALTCKGLDEMLIVWKFMWLGHFAINTNFVPLKFFLYLSFPFSGRTISITFSLFMMRLGIITMVLLFSFIINMKMVNDLQFGLFLTGCVWVTRFLVIIYSLDTVFNSSYGSCNPLYFLGCRQDTFLPIKDTYVQL